MIAILFVPIFRIIYVMSSLLTCRSGNLDLGTMESDGDAGWRWMAAAVAVVVVLPSGVPVVRHHAPLLA